MLDVAIIGGGLCGVALTRTLHRQGRDAVLFEARQRLGGRILSVPFALSGLAADLGPTWFWPETQPLVTRLVSDLGLSAFPQHDEGHVLHLRDPDKTAEPVGSAGVHSGARRLDGGMARLVEALALDIPGQAIRLGHELAALRDEGDHVALTFRCALETVAVEARHVVLAMPPRLVAERIAFSPALDEATREALIATATWMAAEAKVAFAYARPFWREARQSGNAFVTHGQAVIGEIFDACDETGTAAALGGFLALTPEQRDSFSVGLPMLMASQMVQVFGSALEHGEQLHQDWATEPYTCSALDRSAPRPQHADVSSPLLRRPLWEGKLFLGGSETAAHAPGYLEGALDTARRIDRALVRTRAPVAADELSAPQTAVAADGPEAVNAASLARFGVWVAAQGDAAFDGYRQRLNRALAAQQRDQLSQRAVVGAVEDVFARAGGVLEGLAFDTRNVPVERGRSALTPEVQRPFRDFIQSLLDDVAAFNRTSCALSNFPEEHHLSKEYTQAILRDIAAAWQDFSLSANRVLLAKGAPAPVGGRPNNPAEQRLP